MSGEEIVGGDRSTPIAKIVPLGQEESDLEERELVSSGSAERAEETV